MEVERVVCPHCGKKVHNVAAVRQGLVPSDSFGEVNIIEIGFECPECGHEWGFEVFADENTWKQARERFEEKLRKEI